MIFRFRVETNSISSFLFMVKLAQTASHKPEQHQVVITTALKIQHLTQNVGTKQQC